jgi:hypothetical protein
MSQAWSMDKKALQSMINAVPKKPQQPADHESRCPCYECEQWASDLIDWEQDILQSGGNPWAR